MIKEIKKQFKAFGTDIEIQIVFDSENLGKKAKDNVEEISRQYLKYENIFSRFDEASELSKLNSNLGKYLGVSEEFVDVARLVLDYHNETEKYFDPRILEQLEKSGYDKSFEKLSISENNVALENGIFENPLRKDLKIQGNEICFNSKMDFSGIVKGYVTDKVAKFLKSNGWKDFVVDSGGDMFLAGKDIHKNKWTVDIEGFPAGKIMFALSDLAIATSGIAKRKWQVGKERFHHLINPKDNKNYCFDIKTVTVISDSATNADVWAKTLFIAGLKEAKEIAQQKKLACVILDCRNNAWISEQAKKYV